jgi:hypothetical protein
MNYNAHTKKQGIGMIEIIVGIGIFITVIISVVSAYRFLMRFSGMTSRTVKAHYLLEEGAEVARILRDSGWDMFTSLALDTPYYLARKGNSWEATTTTQVIEDGFYRTMLLSEVYRDASGDIAISGTLDSGMRFVTISVSWLRGTSTTTRSMSLYLANLFE